MSEQRGRVRTEASNKRVRVFVGGECIVDSDDALYVWEGPFYPQYYLPLADFRDGALVPTATTKHSPSRGTATCFTVRAGEREIVDSAWTFADSPIEELHGRVRLEQARHRRHRRGRLSPTLVPVRDRPAAPHLHTEARRAHGPAHAVRQHVDVPVQGHRPLLVDPCQRRGPRRPGLELPLAA